MRFIPARYVPLAASFVGIFVFAALVPWLGKLATVLCLLCLLLSAIGIWDMIQTKHSLRRNYPILANIRFMLEEIRPEIRQYFLESDTDGVPYNRSKRAVAYQRAKGQLDKRPFGTQLDVYAEDFEWLTHSMAPVEVPSHDFRVTIGGPQCLQPYSASLLNISAMSFGSLSANAIRALNKGAKLGGFAHDTGEGSFSIHHREFGGDTIWEIASGYFGCRNPDGSFCAERFEAQARDPQIKMIEIKLSQGAKPGHGGVLPGAKVSPEIAAARGIPVGIDCISPASHPAFSTPVEMMQFIGELRRLSGGKPVGFKLCIGLPNEFMAICKAMQETGILADFIVIDGSEGGTGAAPLEFTDHLGTPLREGLAFAHNCLVGMGLREHVKLGAGGRIITAFDMARVLALGADWCNVARGFMFALGCVQSLSCHTDRCPTGVATQDPVRQKALIVPDKAERVRRFHDSTLAALAELIAAAGISHPGQLRRSRIMKRLSPIKVASFADVYPELAKNEIILGSHDGYYADVWARSDANSFLPCEPAHSTGNVLQMAASAPAIAAPV
ncbi:MAG TPA: FMN-binding glutamate synthase family protein [Beijerinckiaceae bacterium]|nr:FMN-binding glutamate synthase family protein [Beijerinckiaceae bacterium]